MPPPSDLVGAQLLDLPAALLRVQARKGETVRQLIRRQVFTVLARIDRLQGDADAETTAAWELMVDRAVEGLGRSMERVSAALPTEARWRAILDDFAADLRSRHGRLNQLAGELATRMIDVGPRALGVDLPAAVPHTVRAELSPARLYDEVLKGWQFGKPARPETEDRPGRPAIPSMRDAIAGIVDLARRGEIGLEEGMIRAREHLDVPRREASRLMRTGVGAAQAGSSQQRLEEVDAVTTGLLKVWWSALAVNTRPWHRRAHGQKRPVAEAFEILSPTRGGGRAIRLMMHPMDPAGGDVNLWSCQCTELADVSALGIRTAAALR